MAPASTLAERATGDAPDGSMVPHMCTKVLHVLRPDGFRLFRRRVVDVEAAVGAESYYLSPVANGLEDYYSGRGRGARVVDGPRG